MKQKTKTILRRRRRSYLQNKGINFVASQTTANRFHNVLERNLHLVAVTGPPDPELDPTPLGHDPSPDALPRLQHAQGLVVDQKAGVQNGVVQPVLRVQGPGDDVIVGLEKPEVMGLDDEIGGEGERLSSGFVLERRELDATVAARAPVVVAADDFNGEDRVRSERRFEED